MSDEEILKRAMGHFKTRMTLHRMGIPLTDRHPVSDAEYQDALESAEQASRLPAYCRCPFTDSDGTLVPGEWCPIHDSDHEPGAGQ